METEYIAREYTTADLPKIEEWWNMHRPERFPAELLPPVGVIVDDGEPCAAAWMYMAVGIGVCWIEFPIARPGLSLTQSRKAFAAVIGALMVIARTHDYHVMIANTLPSIARHLIRAHGFTPRAETISLERRI